MTQPSRQHHHHHQPRRCRRRALLRASFTLTELLVVMGIIALLATVTTVSYRGISKDAKLASAKNTVMVVLDNARALAMRNNQITMVAFRPRLEENNKQVIEAVMCEFTGKGRAITVGTAGQIVESLVPMNGVPTRALPAGIKIAAPFYGDNQDTVWVTQSHFPAVDEIRGSVIGVMYAPDGTTITRNPTSGSHRMFIDFNNNCTQEIDGNVFDYFGCVPSSAAPVISPIDFNGTYFLQHKPADEPYVDVAAFVAVFDDDVVRQQYDTNQWKPAVVGGPAAAANRQLNYTQFITNNADPIHFNRYTGVAMK